LNLKSSAENSQPLNSQQRNSQLRIVIAQLNMFVGDVQYNVNKCINALIDARDKYHADIIVFPELALTGYPPEDLLLRPGFYTRISDALEKLKHEAKGIDVIIGYPEKKQQGVFNAAAVISNGEIVANYHKHHLPNYSVFDEKRYFIPGDSISIIQIKGIPIGITICEDIWMSQPVSRYAQQGARLIINLNASPFHINKDIERIATLQQRVKETSIPIVYVNLVGGQDELVFDGDSFVMNEKAEISFRAPAFVEGLYPVDFEITKDSVELVFSDSPCSIGEDKLPEEASIYNALVLGVKDYILKNGFDGAVIGLSGGIDSALTLAIAVDAIGSENVEAVMMPSQYTADMSLQDAQAEANNLRVDYRVIPIEPIFNVILDSLKDEFAGTAVDATEENIQARCRGVILMAISNKKGKIVLTTGNKSEMAVGYATLYGDMAGGFDVLKDVPKTMVYRLADYRNNHYLKNDHQNNHPNNRPQNNRLENKEYAKKPKAVIPQRVLDRPPTAELAPDQFDQDSLPPYPVLDSILKMYIEKDLCKEDIVAAGYDEEIVLRIIGLVDKNEYKRRQAAPGVRITKRAFGRDRRYPITSGYNRD